MNTKKWKFKKVDMITSSVNFSLVIGALLFLNSCGMQNAGDALNTDQNPDLGLACDQINSRIDACEYKDVFSEELKEDGDGVLQPVSKDPLIFNYDFDKARPDLRKEWEFGKYLGEFKGFLNSGKTNSEQDISQLIAFFETLSKYKDIQMPDGTKFFSDSYRANSRWKKIDDEVDGQLSDDGDFFRLYLKANLGGINIAVKSSLLITRDDEKITVFLKNEEPIKVAFSTIVEKDGFRLKWEFYPYQNGYIVYGGQAISPKSFDKEIKEAFAEDFATAVFNWFKSSQNSSPN